MRRTRTSRVRDLARGPARGIGRSAGTEHTDTLHMARIARWCGRDVLAGTGAPSRSDREE